LIGACLSLPLPSFAVDQEQVIYYHNDALGSPIAATDKNGNVLWREQYAPFGSRLSHESREIDCDGEACMPVESSWDEKLWYTGKLEETRVGLQYFGARWYEPETGRFLSPDPILFKESNPFSFNRYVYANANPFRYVDPDGREATQVGLSFRLPKLFGLVQQVLKKDIEVSGFAMGLAWSSPDMHGRGEYDIGVFFTANLQGGGMSSGRLAVTYSESRHGNTSVKDLAGIGGSSSLDIGTGGINVGYSNEGVEMIGIHFGPGIGASAQGEATTLISAKHGKIGWHDKADSSSTSKSSSKTVSEKLPK
jgi:RHS repeat-associated protein